MLVSEIEDLVKDDNGLLELVNRFKDSFEKLEGYANSLETAKLQPADIQNLLIRSTGIWGILNIVWSVIDTHKTNKESELFNQIKMELEGKEKGKFNVSATKEEVSGMVVNERRVRNIFGAYRDMADKNILSCQSYLKYLTESYKRSSHQEG